MSAAATRSEHVREAINQGFARAELASLADAQATKVYQGAHADGTVVANRITGAVENYQAAISCFVKALPFLPDDGSSELVRNEIRRLMGRLGQLQQMLAEVTGGEGGPAPASEDDDRERKLMADLLFRVGDRVAVLVDDVWRPGTVTAVDYERGTYAVQLDDGSATREDVEAGRVRAHNDTAAEREQIVSEIVESERVFRDQLRFLIRFYLVPLSKPQHWGGAKDATETVFSQKTISASEMKQLFGNIEELAGTSEVFHASLEARFTEWSADQKLGDIFITFAPFFTAFAVYADCVRTSVEMLARLRRERESFDAVVEGAQAKGAPPLEQLMKSPMMRVLEYKQQLDRLIHRTPSSHPDYESLCRAFVAIGKVEEDIALILNRKENQRKIKDIEQLFKPAVNLTAPSRLLLRFSDKLQRFENGHPVKRLVWLFNDMILVGRNSEWLAVGSYRHVADCMVKGARAAPEFGPLALVVSGRRGEEWVFLAATAEEKKAWLLDLKAFGQGGRASSTPGSSGVALGQATIKQVEIARFKRQSSSSSAAAAHVSPPAVELLEGDWTQLVDQASGKPYYFSPSLQRTTWTRPMWRPAKATYAFQPENVSVDAELVQGEALEVMLEGCDEGWAMARFTNRAGGLVPLNRLQLG